MNARANTCEDLRDLAEQATGQAYAPYSRLHVGAALRSVSGWTYTGSNVENAAFPIGMCAERAAIAAAVQAEGSHFRLEAIAVAAVSAKDGELLPITPCGACRQAIVEFGPDALVSFHTPEGAWLEISADALLPYRFSFPQA
ncbi:MAG: cytidine deaminase [Thermomonas sp.]|uniref:cytidine deaminase n=1 Tax=Thermomonas sp. TaxID=1971895 RepID=UPI00261FAD56|nr:cytidine deaminase [Thermomonas sp.]MCC7097730.1 cytidine deaminase [Thermomonas sp.]